MTNAARFNVIDLLTRQDVDNISEHVRDDATKGAGKLASMSKLKLSKSWISERLHKELEMDALEVVGQAWVNAREIKAAAKRTRENPGTTEFISLGKHTIGQDINPYVTLNFAGMDHEILEITIKVQAKFEAVQLSVTDGHITHLTGDKCTLGAIAKYGETKLYDKSDWKEYDLPGEFWFTGDGIKIA